MFQLFRDGARFDARAAEMRRSHDDDDDDGHVFSVGKTTPDISNSPASVDRKSAAC